MRERLSVAVLAVLIAATGCSRDSWQRAPGPDDAVGLVPWFATMKKGLAIQPYQMMRNPVPGTVPVTGAEPPLPVLPANYAAIDRLRNPVERTAASLERGKERYDIYCAVCHGFGGAADGPVAAQMGAVRNLVIPPVTQYSDGRIYAVIRHGFGLLMPAYGDELRPEDRWHIVNYVRVLQGAR